MKVTRIMPAFLAVTLLAQVSVAQLGNVLKNAQKAKKATDIYTP